MRTKVITALLLASCAAREASPQQPSSRDAQVITQLRALRPLPKVHCSWSLPLELLSPDNPRLREYVRITHSACLNGAWAKPVHVDAAVQVCKYVNAGQPDIPATLAIGYTPWKDYSGKDLPPTDQGHTHTRELAVFAQRLGDIREWVATSNQRHRAQIRVSVILLNSERFNTKAPGQPGASSWNAAIASKHNALYDIVKSRFPEARVEWYNFGAVLPSSHPTGWSQVNIHNLSEKHDGFSVSLYRVPEIGYTRESFRRTAKNARAHDVDSVTPYVALGCGYRRQVSGAAWAWDFHWDYDLVYSWLLGQEINHSWFGDRPERFAPWHAAKAVCFWPPPFDKRCPVWTRHFIAYVRGANGVKELP